MEIHDKMYIYLESVSCFGGLPLGVSGKVGALIRNTADMYAAWLMMKRGASIFPIGKDINIDILEKYSYGQKLSLNLVSDDEIAGFLQENDCGAVVVGDFFEEFDMKNYEKYKTLVLAPLIAHDDNYVAGKLKKIS